MSARHPGSADALVHSELETLQKNFDDGKVKNNNLIEEVGKIEDKVRNSLENNNVRLQSADPHWQG